MPYRDPLERIGASIDNLSAEYKQHAQDDEDKHVENQGRLTEIEVNQRNHSVDFTDLMKKLFGNGQPGMMEKYDDRLKKMEKLLWMLIGGASLITIINKFPAVAKLFGG